MQGRFLIDISRLVGRTQQGRLPTGVDRVCLEYLAHFGARAQAVLQRGSWRRLVPHDASQELFALLREPGPQFRRQVALVIAKACMPPWPSQDGAGRIYFNLGHSGLDGAGLAQWMARRRVRPVFLAHDLIPITHPEYCRPGEQVQHALRIETMLKTAAGLITNSQSTLSSLEQFAQRRGMAMPAAVAAPLAPAALPAVNGGPSPLSQPYFVVLGTIEPRKNHLLLLHIWRELAQRLGPRTPHLALIGQRGWECENVVDMLERCEALRGVVHELPACSDADLSHYLHHASALLFPSFAEGYGMPMVEALMLGTPVIASKLPVFQEVAADVPDYVDGLDGPAWMRTIEAYAAPGSALRAAQIKRLADFAVPTWASHFRQVDALLERLG